MSLWADKYRPKTLDDLDYHGKISNMLSSLATSGDFPHLLFHGPSGAGKKTRILATLRQIYGPNIEKLKVDPKVFVTATKRKLEFNVVSSPNHLEITPSDMNNNDRVVIQDLLKEVAQTETIDFTHVADHKNRFKVVIINEAELLTRDAQAALRRTMEKYSANIRLVLVCNSISSIIEPIKSRTLLIRVAAPTDEEMGSVFEKVLRDQPEVAKSFPADETERQQIYSKIAKVTDHNLRTGLLLLEALYSYNPSITTKTPMIMPDWENVIKKLAIGIVTERTVSKLQQSRTDLYELISHSIPAKLILKKLTIEFWRLVDEDSKIKDKDTVKMDIVQQASIFDERLSLGSKDIFHLEGFITKVMVVLEKNVS
ncbi:Replication factor C (RF-C) subunit [Komagataella phaffii CBS 7435]|uniref:Replication factor C n=2 Tax=Komagataella phaffii TaxID=460519 RepID=C4QYT8_KOMPG|nr:Replication factor C [Komagataella phaffii GS115]AOA61438.1 GQ67_01591T0 [Komagataella phaffii]CAH2447236.1 Replication factor C (RF-C) subunit [Komagataella phaffii CBS 7435]AOA66594.1 GQ68_01607T0 [Komagataella phaffii GS115]CAY68412.1 Replication factor C [Komagataella phaffii GS115]CCA37477.1 Replication factor C (RF-C) subunit [Komagataella phaffii CBS 7435]